MRERRLPIIRAAMKQAAAYQQAILLLDEYPIDGREEKSARARELLEQAAASRPTHARTRPRVTASAEREACEEFQRELARSFDPSRVPDELRPLADWAARYGVGDDHCRPYLMKRLTRSQKDRLIRTMDDKADAVQRWLDRFAAGKFTDEAAAFMYLAEGVEEIRDIDGSKEKP
jgi:hypothetical protein